MATVREIAGYLEERVPSSLKLDFDNVGLLCGFPEREVSRVLVVLDITHQAIEEALSLHAELIVSHHPVIFTPLRRVCTDTPDAKRVIALLQGHRLLLPSAGGDAAFRVPRPDAHSALRARYAVLRRRTPCRISGALRRRRRGHSL